MQIAGHTADDLRDALERVSNARFGGNLKIRGEITRVGTTGKSKYLNVRITVKATRDKGGEVLPGVHTTRDFRSGSRDGLRANASASFDAHGEFFHELYRLNPDTIVKSGSVASGGMNYRCLGDLFRVWMPGYDRMPIGYPGY